MEKKFVIGDREKNEWISVFDNGEKKMEFKNDITGAQVYVDYEKAKADLAIMQSTGFFGDLQVYLLEDGKAYKAFERDSFHPVD